MIPVDLAQETIDAPPPALPEVAEVELRVLQGPQAGCRLLLAPGQVYSLGTSDECSIVLVGPGVEPEHARLLTQADMVEVTAVDGSVFIDGIELVASSEAWEPGSVFLVGRVALCVDEVDRPWPSEADIAASIAKALEAAPADDGFTDPADDDHDDPERTGQDHDAGDDEADEDDGSDDDDDDDDPVDGYRQPTPGDGPHGSVGTVPGRGVSGSMPQDARQRLNRTLAASGLALAGAVGTIAWIGLSSPAPSATAAPVSIDIGGLTPTTTPAGAPATTAPAPAVPAPTREAVAARLDALVQELQIPDRLSARWFMKDDRPHLRMAMTDMAGAPALRERIAALEPETGPVEVEIVGPADMARLFRDMLEAGGLQRRFITDPADPDPLHFKASLAQDELPRWERLFLSFTERHGHVPPVTVQISNDVDRLGDRIGSVVGGAFPYIVTPEGHRIAPGGRLMGRTVTSVQTGEVVFADGLRYRFIQ